MPESQQKTLERVRRPRVNITYEVYTPNGMVKKHLPFVVGVLADLSGQPKTPLKPVGQRAFIEIDRDNFNEVLKKQTPRLVLKVPDRLTGSDSQIGVELNFKSLDDFEPANVAKQIPQLKELLDMRQRLSELLALTGGKNESEKLLEQLLENMQKTQTLAEGRGLVDSKAPSTEESQ